MKENINSIIPPCDAGLTEVPADVDVKVAVVVAVVHLEAVAHFDQWAEVVLLPVRVEHVTRHLDTTFVCLFIWVGLIFNDVVQRLSCCSGYGQKGAAKQTKLGVTRVYEEVEIIALVNNVSLFPLTLSHHPPPPPHLPPSVA